MEPKAEEPIGLTSQLWSLLEASQEHWLGSFLLNLLGYALIIVPAGLLIRRWKKDPRIKRGKPDTHFQMYVIHVILSNNIIYMTLVSGFLALNVLDQAILKFKG